MLRIPLTQRGGSLITGAFSQCIAAERQITAVAAAVDAMSDSFNIIYAGKFPSYTAQFNILFCP
jgi:hypothetical protein